MQKLIFFILFSAITFPGIAQSVGIDYFYTGSGRNLTASFSERTNDHRLGIGLGYNINSIRQSYEKDIYYRKLFATKPYHHLNLNVYYNRYVFTSLENIKPYLFYDFQYKYSTTRSTSNYGTIVDHHGPFYWIEKTIGAGFEVDITNRWYITQKAGLGLHILHGKELPTLSKIDTEFYSMLNFGIGFRLNKKQ